MQNIESLQYSCGVNHGCKTVPFDSFIIYCETEDVNEDADLLK